MWYSIWLGSHRSLHASPKWRPLRIRYSFSPVYNPVDRAVNTDNAQFLKTTTFQLAEEITHPHGPLVSIPLRGLPQGRSLMTLSLVKIQRGQKASIPKVIRTANTATGEIPTSKREKRTKNGGDEKEEMALWARHGKRQGRRKCPSTKARAGGRTAIHEGPRERQDRSGCPGARHVPDCDRVWLRWGFRSTAGSLLV